MRSFAVSKFHSLLPVGLLASLAVVAFHLTDVIVLGHVIGEDALGGFGMTLPLLALVSLVSWSVASGMATNYSICLGRLDRVQASGFFVQAVGLALVLGGVLSLVCLFGSPAYLAALDGSEYVTMYAEQYFSWLWPRAPLEALFLSLLLLAVVDGDRLVAGLASVLAFVLKVVFSYAAVDRFGAGAGGCALGTLVAEGVGLLVLLVHFARASSTFRPVLGFSPRAIRLIFRASLGDTSAIFSEAALFFVLNKFLIRNYGSDLLPAAGPALAVWMLQSLFVGIALAARPLVAVYYGETNVRGVARLLTAALRAAVVLGGCGAALFAVFPDLAVAFAGIEEPELLDAARQGVRLVAMALPGLAVANLYKSYCLFIERPRVSLFVSVVCYFVAPAACVLALGRLSYAGVWIALAAGPVLGFGSMLAIIFVRYGRGNLLLMPKRWNVTSRMIDLRLEPFEIVAASKRVAALVPEALAVRAALLVEEVFMAVRDRNAGRRLRGEVTLDRSADGVTLTLRDDGEIFDITDADQRISSLRTYLVASVMERQKERLSLATTGFNRNVFRL